jgi:hypothetical protein
MRVLYIKAALLAIALLLALPALNSPLNPHAPSSAQDASTNR